MCKTLSWGCWTSWREHLNRGRSAKTPHRSQSGQWSVNHKNERSIKKMVLTMESSSSPRAPPSSTGTNRNPTNGTISAADATTAAWLRAIDQATECLRTASGGGGAGRGGRGGTYRHNPNPNNPNNNQNQHSLSPLEDQMAQSMEYLTQLETWIVMCPNEGDWQLPPTVPPPPYTPPPTIPLTS